MTPFLHARGIHKRFPGVQALSNVDAVFSEAETVAVIGENGAGKSTLMKVLAGVHHPDSGDVLLNGNPVSINSVSDAMSHGIAFIHQELNLADNLSIGANVFLGREPVKGGLLRLIDRQSINIETGRLLGQLGLNIPPTTLVRDLSIGQQQMVEIAKALSMNARMIIMDEPTSSLTIHETQNLFRVVRALKEQGTCIVFISHRLTEIQEIADRVIGLRDGCNSGELCKDDISHDAMVSLMVGRSLDSFEHHSHLGSGDDVLQVDGLLVPHLSSAPISFSLKSGEILGVAGLVGAGRTELSRVLFGLDPYLSGRISLNGQSLKLIRPKDAIAAGIGLVPEDRKHHGLVLDMSIKENLAMPQLSKHRRGGFVSNESLSRLADDQIKKLNIKTTDAEKEVQMLSGGNQQKVVLAKWLAMDPSVLILDEPTRGVDVRSKSEIYQLIEEMAGKGMAVMMISSDLEEVIRMSDRVMVMHDGRIVGFLNKDSITEEAIMDMATGKTRHAESVGVA